jgi:hypothetical protein
MQERLAKARDNVGSYWQPNEPGITPLRDTAR